MKTDIREDRRDRSNRNILFVLLAALFVMVFVGYSIYVSGQQEKGAEETGSSTQANKPGSVQDRQPAGTPSQAPPPLHESNVPPAGPKR
jgi:hypothetical protein